MPSRPADRPVPGGRKRGPEGSEGDRPSSWPVRQAVSAGGLAIRMSASGPEVAMISHRTIKGELVWGLPKGTVEAGESIEEAAVREVTEETGLQVEIVESIKAITYWFAWPPERVRYRKTVHFFLMRAIGGDMSLHDGEVEDVAFVPLPDAARRARYTSERKLLEQAAGIVAGWPPEAGGAAPK